MRPWLAGPKLYRVVNGTACFTMSASFWEVAMDIVFLHDLRIETVIGIYDWEREVRQTVILDLEMGTDVRRGAASDRIEDALDYKAVAKRLIAFVGESRFRLVETLAERCAGLLREEFGVPWVRLRVNKVGAVTGARDVGVLIERGHRE
jgi:dihydroneopterin aldolase